MGVFGGTVLAHYVRMKKEDQHSWKSQNAPHRALEQKDQKRIRIKIDLPREKPLKNSSQSSR